MHTRSIHALRLTLAGALALFTHTTFAQTWQTVDDYQLTAGKSSQARALAINPNGNLFVGGWGTPASSYVYGAQIRCSADGITWALCDDFPSLYGSIYTAIASDSVGNLYAASQIEDLGGGNHSIVSLSQDSGVTWFIVDDVSDASPTGIATDSFGNIYVVNSGWNVRKGTAGGASWSTVDSFNPGGVAGQAYAVFCHPTAGVFVTGQANTGKKGASMATTRRSLDGGATWTTVDSAASGIGFGIGADAAGNIYSVSSTWTVRKSANGGTGWATVDTLAAGTATGFAADAHGNLFVVGYTYINQADQWVVRENPGGNTSWRTVDTFQYVPGHYAVAAAVAADSFGNVYVAGHGDDVNGHSHWIVRKH